MKAILKPLSEFNPLPIEYLWEPYLPKYTLTIEEGAPGIAKGFLAVKIAATATQGLSIWPGSGQTIGRPLKVLWMTYEDDWHRVVRPRFDAAGGDPSQVYAFLATQSTAGAAESGFDWGKRDALLNALDQVGDECLIVADPINGFLPHGCSEMSTAQLREVIQPVMQILQERKATLIGIRHHRKGNLGNAAEAGAGSLGGWTGLARSVLAIFRDPDGGTGDRVLAHVKCNLAEPGQSLKFHIAKGRVNWTGVSKRSADDLHAAGRDTPDNKEQAAVNFLKDALSPGPMSAQDVIALAAQASIAKRTLYRAKDALHVSSVRATLPSGGNVGTWDWSLPR